MQKHAREILGSVQIICLIGVTLALAWLTTEFFSNGDACSFNDARVELLTMFFQVLQDFIHRVSMVVICYPPVP